MKKQVEIYYHNSRVHNIGGLNSDETCPGNRIIHSRTATVFIPSQTVTM